MVQKRLKAILAKNSGRDNTGQVSVRHQGGRHKRFYRSIDFKRDKKGVNGKVMSFEYDPNRNVDIGLVQYEDGEKRYVVEIVGLKVGDVIKSGPGQEIRPGNALPLGDIPVGTLIHNVEITPHKGGKMVRAAGTAASVLAKEGDFVQVKFPSGEIRKISVLAMATVGQVGNIDFRNIQLGKAGRARHMGRRPTVRGVAQNPRSHPHGGGEGRSGIGMPSPKSPWGKHTLGKKTRRPTKYSDQYILSRGKK